MKELVKKDLVEGEKAFERFDALVGRVLSVPRKEMKEAKRQGRGKTEI